jgi:hypothetical protein
MSLEEMLMHLIIMRMAVMMWDCGRLIMLIGDNVVMGRRLVIRRRISIVLLRFISGVGTLGNFGPRILLVDVEP